MPSVFLLLGKMPCSTDGKICAWWMRYDEIPASGLCVCVCIGGLKCAVAIDNRKHIPSNMPLWMPAGAILDITAKSFVAKRPESFAHFLTFFASYKYVYNVPSFSSIQFRKTSRLSGLLCSSPQTCRQSQPSQGYAPCDRATVGSLYSDTGEPLTADRNSSRGTWRGSL